MTTKKNVHFNRQAFLDRLVCKLVPCEIPGFDEVFIKELTARQIVAIGKMHNKDKGSDDSDADYLPVVLSVCDKDGNQLLQEEDVKILKEQSGGVFMLLSKKVNEVNHLDAEETAKN